MAIGFVFHTRIVSDLKPIRWGILACGNIANAFAAAVNETERSVLHAVAARDAEKAQAFATKHGAIRAYGSYEAMLADSDVDAVYIATLHPFHLEWITHSVQAGKHVLCEKPLTMNLRQAKQAQKMALEKRCLLREAFMYRHHPQTKKVVELVESGLIGKIRMIEANFCFNSGVSPGSRTQARELGGGGVLDVGCYPVSFARLIAGRAQDRLFAEPLELKAVGHLDSQTRTDMWSTASLRFEGDILASLSCGVRLNTENRAVVYGDQGRIMVENPWHCKGAIRMQLDGESVVTVQEADLERHLFAYELDAFVAEMRGRPIAPRAVGMRFDDTLGNMKALDWWRAEIGLGYEADSVR
ncbi:MAG TPA: gfo/Idh/MocA family oxidoreductase [Opitutae bacterium]|nr:gfo/Idh/MocA family oxidoreductase [Opitutae bacterium]